MKNNNKAIMILAFLITLTSCQNISGGISQDGSPEKAENTNSLEGVNNSGEGASKEEVKAPTTKLRPDYDQSKLSEENLLNSLAIYQGISIEGIDVAGLPRLGALEGIKKILDPKLDEIKIDLTYKDKKYTKTLRDLGYTYDYETASKEAFAKGRDGSDRNRKLVIPRFKEKPEDIKVKLIENKDKLKEVLGQINSEIAIPATDAGYKYNPETDKVEALPGEPGLEIDMDKTIHTIQSSTDKSSSVAISTKDSLINKASQAKADRVKGQIGFAESSFNPWFWARVENIRVSTQTLNGYVVGPGETFSFNNVIGDTTADKGYQESIIIMGTEEVPGMGGGVCQTSTCLYQAALKAGMEIVERHPHTLIMSYSEGGLDAAVEYGLIDMVFKNPYDFPVLIKSHYEDGYISFSIWGDTDVKNYDISIYSVFNYSKDFSTEYQFDPSLGPGEEKTKIYGNPGQSYSAYRVNGATGEEEYLGDTWYPVVNTLILKGE